MVKYASAGKKDSGVLEFKRFGSIYAGSDSPLSQYKNMEGKSDSMTNGIAGGKQALGEIVGSSFAMQPRCAVEFMVSDLVDGDN